MSKFNFPFISETKELSNLRKEVRKFISEALINNEFESKIDGSYTPLDYFKIFVDSSILDLVCKKTNLYAKEYGVSNIDNPWYDVNEDEIMVYIALKMLMRILRNPEERMYWKDNIIILTPYFKGFMSTVGLQRYNRIFI